LVYDLVFVEAKCKEFHCLVCSNPLSRKVVAIKAVLKLPNIEPKMKTIVNRALESMDFIIKKEVYEFCLQVIL